MRALLDINVLIALMDLDHPQHSWAKNLLALAVRNGGRFVTFDGAIPLDAVRKAKPRHLHILTSE